MKLAGKLRISVVCLLAVCGDACAEREMVVEVFTEQGMAITQPEFDDTAKSGLGATVEIFHVDAIARIQRALGQGLPNDPKQAHEMASQRLSQLQSSQEYRTLGANTVGLMRAQGYGLTRVPAMVFDGRAIVYGLTDVAEALSQYRRWLATQQP